MIRDVAAWVSEVHQGSASPGLAAQRIARARRAAELAMTCAPDLGPLAVELAWLAELLETSDVGVQACVQALGSSRSALARLISREIRGEPHTRKPEATYWRMVARAPLEARVGAVCAALAQVEEASAAARLAAPDAPHRVADTAAMAMALLRLAAPLVVDVPVLHAALTSVCRGLVPAGATEGEPATEA